MSPARVPGSDNYRFNRQVRGVGRIVRSSETASMTEFRYRDGILTKLIRAAALDILREFQSGNIGIGELVTADREGRLFQVYADMKIAAPLEPALEKWFPDSAPADASRKRYKTSWKRFLRICKEVKQLKREPTVAALRNINFRRLRNAWQASGSDWNRARSAVSAFLSDFLGSVHHPLRLEVIGQWDRADENSGRIPTVTVMQFWKIVDSAPEHVRAVYATMAILGVGPKEQRGIRKEDLHADIYTVTVNGTKTINRQREVAVDPRLWDWVVRSVPCPMTYKYLRDYWIQACAAAEVKDLRMYDLRHLSGQLAGDEGMSDRDLMIHLGHSNPAMSHRYTRRRTVRTVAKAIGDALTRPQPPAAKEA